MTRLGRAIQVGGGVAVAAGLHTAVSGARWIPPFRRADPGLESELRFYATFYVAYGAALMRLAARADRDPALLRPLAAPLFLGGLARTGGWARVGRPHPTQVILLALELVLPPLALAEQARLNRAASGSR